MLSEQIQNPIASFGAALISGARQQKLESCNTRNTVLVPVLN
jgi:hypothetical protein